MSNTINTFSIGKANYYIVGNNGERIELKLDYANNSYSVKIRQGVTVSKQLHAEVALVANHLLRDKARKNLVQRLRDKNILS